MMYKRHFKEISRLMSLVKSVSEVKRATLQMSRNEYAKQIRLKRTTFNNFMIRPDGTLNIMFEIANYVPIKIYLIYKDEEYQVRDAEQFKKIVLRYANRYQDGHGITCADMANLSNVSPSNYRYFRNDTNSSKKVQDRLIKKCGMLIRAECNQNPEKGDEIRSKQIQRMRRRNKTERIENEEYVSEYKKEIKERLKKLWP